MGHAYIYLIKPFVRKEPVIEYLEILKVETLFFVQMYGAS